MNRQRQLLILGILLFCGAVQPAHAEDSRILFDLRGEWKFEIGDGVERAARGFDDSRWDVVFAPSAWEDEGYPGYDGFAWYRKHFSGTSDWNAKALFLHLGTIDDVDEVFVNGHRIGSTGTFPPRYATAYFAERIYPLPQEYLDPSGDNVVAVRVYDHELSGGILRGRIGVFEDRDALVPDLPLVLDWKFSTGDDSSWSNPAFRDDGWSPITVPAYWEKEGYREYDGFAWYRISFKVSRSLAAKNLILLLGQIDDFDETYLNGQQIGKTGSMRTRKTDIPGSDAYSKVRSYVIPPGLLNPDATNTIAVRVYDGYRDGGIYSGPVGIVTSQHYRAWQKAQQKGWNFLDWIFK